MGSGQAGVMGVDHSALSARYGTARRPTAGGDSTAVSQRTSGLRKVLARQPAEAETPAPQNGNPLIPARSRNAMLSTTVDHGRPTASFEYVRCVVPSRITFGS